MNYRQLETKQILLRIPILLRDYGANYDHDYFIIRIPYQQTNWVEIYSNLIWKGNIVIFIFVII